MPQRLILDGIFGMGMGIVLVLTVVALGGVESDESAEALDGLLQPWQDAVESFEQSQEKAIGLLFRLLDGAEEKARAAGDLDKLETLKQEKKQFEERGILPTSVKSAAYERSMNSARSALRASAKKVKIALLKQKFDDAAVALDKELDGLIGPNSTGVRKPAPAAHAIGKDQRTFWKAQVENGNEFHLVNPGEWIETVHLGAPRRFHWQERHRTPEFIELYDKDREFGMRLRSGSADVDYKYKPAQKGAFGLWTHGNWIVAPPDVVYLADLDEITFKVWDYLEDKKSGWGKNGMVEGERIFLDNRPSVKGLLTYPPAKDFAMVKYDIAKLRKQIFRARFGIADWKQKDPESPLTFIVLGDGEKLFTSKPLQNWKTVEDCEVNIRNVKELELRVECPGGAAAAFAVWYEPRLSLN